MWSQLLWKLKALLPKLELEFYLDYARVDWENGILDVEGYQIEVQTVNAIRNTILQCYTEVPEEQNGEKVEN